MENNTFSTKIDSIISLALSNDIESAISLICPLLDNAAKNEIGESVEFRIHKLIDTEKDFLYWVISFGYFRFESGADISYDMPIKNKKGEIEIKPITLGEVIQRFIRNELLHDASLTSVELVNDMLIGPQNGKILLPKISFFLSLLLLVSCLSTYKNKSISDKAKAYRICIPSRQILLKDLWGNKQEIMKFFNSL